MAGSISERIIFQPLWPELRRGTLVAGLQAAGKGVRRLSASFGNMGSFNHTAAQVDVHGSLTPTKKLYGRIIIAGLDEESSFDNLREQARYVSPSLKLDITDRDSLTWS